MKLSKTLYLQAGGPVEPELLPPMGPEEGGMPPEGGAPKLGPSPEQMQQDLLLLAQLIIQQLGPEAAMMLAQMIIQMLLGGAAGPQPELQPTFQRRGGRLYRIG